LGIVEAVRGPQRATTQVRRLTDGGGMGETGLSGVAAQQGRLDIGGKTCRIRGKTYSIGGKTYRDRRET
jgi:hypothetical protein